jgi:hypothetical protein
MSNKKKRHANKQSDGQMPPIFVRIRGRKRRLGKYDAAILMLILILFFVLFLVTRGH